MNAVWRPDTPVALPDAQLVEQPAEIRIDKGVPLPDAPVKRATHPLAIVMAKLSIGDSFLWPKEKRDTLSIYARRAGIKLTVRVVDADNVRVWRKA